jgi:hypothetical protein
MDDMEDFLKGEIVEPTAEVAETPPGPVEAEAVEAEPVKAEQPRGPDGKFLPKGETPEAPAQVASPATEEPKLEHPALIGERRRRQEAEQRAKELEAQLQQFQNPPQPAPDMFENPEGWQGHFGQQVVGTAVQQATINSKLEMSEMLARDKFDDFDEMKTKFMELAEQNPVLAQQALGDPHPWRKAYQIAKTATTMQEVGATDVGSLRAEIEARVRAELEAKQPAPPPPIPDTLATAQSARGSSAEALPTPLSLEQILGRAAT